MALILAGIHSLIQHLQQLNSNPEAYRPERCPQCGGAKLWSHGRYQRHADRENNGKNSLNTISIPRFVCAQDNCGKTCSVLPECIPPRRWYLWSVQQAMLILLLHGQLDGEQALPYARTIWRWWTRLKACFDIHRYHLVEQNSRLGQHTSVADFWAAYFSRGTLSKAMLTLHYSDIVIP